MPDLPARTVKRVIDGTVVRFYETVLSSRKQELKLHRWLEASCPTPMVQLGATMGKRDGDRNYHSTWGQLREDGTVLVFRVKGDPRSTYRRFRHLIETKRE